MRTKRALCGLMILTMLSLSFPSVSQGSPQTGLEGVKFTSLPIVVGLLDRVDMVNEKIYIGLDKDRKKMEEVEIKRIRAVYLIQGNHEKLMNYLVGGAGGGALGLSGLFMRNKLLTEKEAATQVPIEPGEVLLWSSVGAGIGLVVGWLRGRGVENVRAFPVYDLEMTRDEPVAAGKRNLRDKNNIAKISPGTMIHVVIGVPE
ncbi:MAG: hypothetical protein Q7S32_02195 [bacterium]|nr:hypothetical protein [bacterium]